MKNFNLYVLLAFLATAFLFTSCDDDEGSSSSCNCSEGICVETNITSDETWTTGNIYSLCGRIAVESGATLTIEPGVIVKGLAGSGANASALLVARGGRIQASGTSSEPIIFTAESDNIQPGQLAGSNLADTTNGLWGGLIVLGNAPISADAEAVQIEGIPPSDINGLYGGTTANDNSGTLRYISIRHGGANIGEGNEINGLTLGGVGTGTTISHVEVVANQDDGIECFGGTVNIDNALVWNQGDDAYDMDQDYTGTIDNFVYVGGENSDHGMELDGPEGSQDNGGFTLKNGTLIGFSPDGGEYIDFRSNVSCVVENCFFSNFSSDSDVELDNNGVAQNWIDGKIVVRNLQFNTSHLTEGNVNIEDIWVEKADTDEGEMLLDAFGQNPLPSSVQTVSSNGTVGADLNEFNNWTLGAVRGKL